MSVIMRILNYIAKTDWKHNDVVVWDDVNRWETAIDNHNQFLNRYSWLPKKAIKKSSVLLFPFDLSTILIAQNAGTTGTNEPNWEQYIQEDGTVNDIVDGDIIWKAKQFVSSDDTTPIGTIEQKLVSKAPPGWVIMQGGLYNRSEMPLLWAWVQEYGLLVSEVQWQTENTQNGSCAYYSTGNGSTTFRIPNLNCISSGGPQNKAGVYVPKKEISFVSSASTFKFGSYTSTGSSGTAATDLIVTAISYSNTTIDGYVNGVRVMNTAGRSKYGQGATSISFPVPKGASWSVSGSGDVRTMSTSVQDAPVITNSATYPDYIVIPYYLRYDNL